MDKAMNIIGVGIILGLLFYLAQLILELCGLIDIMLGYGI